MIDMKLRHEFCQAKNNKADDIVLHTHTHTSHTTWSLHKHVHTLTDSVMLYVHLTVDGALTGVRLL